MMKTTVVWVHGIASAEGNPALTISEVVDDGEKHFTLKLRLGVKEYMCPRDARVFETHLTYAKKIAEALERGESFNIDLWKKLWLPSI